MSYKEAVRSLSSLNCFYSKYQSLLTRYHNRLNEKVRVVCHFGSPQFVNSEVARLATRQLRYFLNAAARRNVLKRR